MRKRGMTLVEMLVTIAIIGLLAMIAIPLFDSPDNIKKKLGLEKEVVESKKDFGGPAVINAGGGEIIGWKTTCFRRTECMPDGTRYVIISLGEFQGIGECKRMAFFEGKEWATTDFNERDSWSIRSPKGEFKRDVFVMRVFSPEGKDKYVVTRPVEISTQIKVIRENTVVEKE
jgi:prepilin-type N-terminal cleavage/methylation domain-containing protein